MESARASTDYRIMKARHNGQWCYFISLKMQNETTYPVQVLMAMGSHLQSQRTSRS